MSRRWSAVLVIVLTFSAGASVLAPASASPPAMPTSQDDAMARVAPAPAGTWSKNVKLSTDIPTHQVYTEPHMAVTTKGDLVAGWKEADTNTGGGQAVGWTYSSDGGLTWAAAKEHSGGSDIVFTVDENDSVYLNRLGGGCGGSGICTYKSTDGGKTWGPGVATSFGSGFADKNWIDSDHRGRIYHVYDPGSDRPAATVSTDGGATFKGDYTFADPSGGYGYPVVAGDRVYVAGTAPIPADGSPPPDDAYEQARLCLEIIREALERAGSGVEHVVRTRVFVTDPAHFEGIGRAHGEVFADVRPANTTVVASLLDPSWKVEIEAEAVVP